ncbi:MAG: UDP-4-amino-4,6-dideoxy-N-acetyl-beta-L-altrosamine N-acetyltransferase [Clostridia bacterium]|nr:UDP-4-amino-4,6-dideoxy-N-acetyl-beta-L-altrosamine N-acetyltransferase [Clostridia bacterium]
MMIKNNVELRKITKEDTDNIVKWRNKPEVKKNFCIQDDLTRQDHLRWFTNKIQTGEVEQFIIIDRTTNSPVGSTYLRDIDMKNKKAEFGIFIGEDSARNKGIGTDTASLMLQYGFKELQLNKIFLRVFSDNLRAIRAYEKVGFTNEGIAREDIRLPNGKYQDIMFMAKLNK